MMRRFFIALSQSKRLQHFALRVQFARAASRRFVAGETQAEALAVVADLNQKGINATLDHLGENIASESEAAASTEEIIRLLKAIDQSGVRANVSIKLSQLGLLLGEEICAANLRQILQAAVEHHNFIRIDMEDSSLTDATLAQFQQVRTEGFTNVGIVLQAYLYRTEKDMQALLQSGERLRLCKGAYHEPETVAYPQMAEVNDNFDRLVKMLIEGAIRAGAPYASEDGRTPPIPAIATHDPLRIAQAQRSREVTDLPTRAMEFQMLYGIRRDLQEGLAAKGFPVRVYVPYGMHWYPYFMRRLAERPANVMFILRNLFRN